MHIQQFHHVFHVSCIVQPWRIPARVIARQLFDQQDRHNAIHNVSRAKQ